MTNYDYDQADWGAQRVFGDGALPGLWVPDKVVIHYGGNPSFAGDPVRCAARGFEGWPSVAAEMSALRIYEQSHLSRGWRAIGYNAAVGQSGGTYRLRGENPSGATSGDYEPDGIRENAEAYAILAILGGDQVPSDAMLEGIAGLIGQRDTDVVIAHKDVKGTTSCPGPYLSEWVWNEEWRRLLGVPMDTLKIILHAMVDAAWDSGNPNIQPATEPGRDYWHNLVEQIEDPESAYEFYYLWKALFAPVEG